MPKTNYTINEVVELMWANTVLELEIILSPLKAKKDRKS